MPCTEDSIIFKFDTVIRIHIVVKQNIEKINNHVASWIEKVTCETTDILFSLFCNKTLPGVSAGMKMCYQVEEHAVNIN